MSELARTLKGNGPYQMWRGKRCARIGLMDLGMSFRLACCCDMPSRYMLFCPPTSLCDFGDSFNIAMVSRSKKAVKSTVLRERRLELAVHAQWHQCLSYDNRWSCWATRERDV